MRLAGLTKILALEDVSREGYRFRSLIMLLCAAVLIMFFPINSYAGIATYVANSSKLNILMSDTKPDAVNATELPDYSVFGSETVARKDIATITFLDDTGDPGSNAWDVSEAGDGSILAWTKTNSSNEKQYDLYIASDKKIMANKDASYLFAGYSSVTKIDFGECFDTSNVTNMYGMFYNCIKLKNLDVSGFSTSKVSNMGYMFGKCNRLAELDVSCFDTSNVTSMRSMFYNCNYLTSLDVGNFNTSSVTNMRGMFEECGKITNLNLSGFDTSKVTDMSYMFSGCAALRELDISSFNTSRVINMQAMFYQCLNLTRLDMSGFETSNVTDMSIMFCNCEAVTELDISNFKTSAVTDMSYMFRKCSALTNLDVSSFDTSNVTNMKSMFSCCSGLKRLDISNFKTSNVTDMCYMFADLQEDFELTYSEENFDTSKVGKHYKCFMGSSNGETDEESDSFWKKLFE